MGFTRETDHGTPPALATGRNVTLTIDGFEVTVPSSVSCAYVSVPLDYEDPAGETASTST